MPSIGVGVVPFSVSQIPAGGITASMVAAGLVPITLLKANSGTTTSATAENVDTVDISGLTAKDQLYIEIILEDTVAVTANPTLHNATDNVSVSNFSNSQAISIGGTAYVLVHIKQAKSANTAIAAFDVGRESSGNFSGVHLTLSTFTTAWIGAWTLALRHEGVTATGTFKWSWAVYKIAGQ